MKVIRFLFNYSRGLVLVAAITGVVSGASSTGLLAVINTSLTSDHVSTSKLFWNFVGLCIVVPLARVASELSLTYLGQGTIYDLRMQMSRRILSVPLRHLERLGAPRLLSMLTGDIPSITNVVTVVPVLCINLAILVGSLVYLGWLNWRVLIIVLVFITVGIVSYQLPVVRATKYFRRARELRDRLFAHFQALTAGSKELKLHSRRRYVFLNEALEGTAKAYRQEQIAGRTIYTIASSWGQLLVFVTIGLVIFGLPRLGFEAESAQTLTGYTLVLLYLMTPLQVMMNTLPGLSTAEVALRRVEEMGLDLANHATESETEVAPEPVQWRRIELEGVVHTYRSEEADGHDFVLGPLDLSLEPGKLVFIAGGNGSGKTTLSKVLVGLYAPEEGTVRLDGQEVTEETREAYRQYFTAVFSDNYLFDSLLGLESPQLDERARHYLGELQIDHKVEVTDGKLSTTELSQGQRKRLALLTAYLEDRPIYVFDEWAADQDPTFREVFYLEILPELKRRGKTVVVISHDDRYYHVGDQLMKLEYGKVVELMENPRAQEPRPAALGSGS